MPDSLLHPANVGKEAPASFSSPSSTAVHSNVVHPLSCEDVHPPASDGSSDVSRVESLVDNPNPRASVHLEDSEMWVATEPQGGRPVPSTPAISTSFHPFSIHVLSLLMSFSVFGTLARLGLHALASYQGQGIFPLAWVQAVGCGIMGFALAMREPITIFYGPLYVAITTGFCGSLTTFSGWQLDVFLAWADASRFRRLWIYDVMDGLTRTVFTMAVSLASFGMGVHVGKRISPRMPTLSSPGPAVRWVFTIISIAIYVMTIPSFVWFNHSWRPAATAALMFSFPGTFTRYVLSTQLNPRMKALPVGTLIANETATAVLAACHIIQRAPSPPGPVACSILQGIIDGFCGCLSTVSTFVAEIRTLRAGKAWAYFVISFGLGQSILLIMLGSAWWTGCIGENRICTFG